MQIGKETVSCYSKGVVADLPVMMHKQRHIDWAPPEVTLLPFTKLSFGKRPGSEFSVLYVKLDLMLSIVLGGNVDYPMLHMRKLRCTEGLRAFLRS